MTPPSAKRGGSLTPVSRRGVRPSRAGRSAKGARQAAMRLASRLSSDDRAFGPRLVRRAVVVVFGVNRAGLDINDGRR